MTLFERIKENGSKLGLNVKQVAIKAGIGENAIYRWKDSQPTADKLQAVADVLNVSVDYLLGNTDDPTPRDSTTPDWATAADVADLKKFLEDDAASSLNFGGDQLTEAQSKQLRVALTQIFWEELDGEKSLKRGDSK